MMDKYIAILRSKINSCFKSGFISRDEIYNIYNFIDFPTLENFTVILPDFSNCDTDNLQLNKLSDITRELLNEKINSINSMNVGALFETLDDLRDFLYHYASSEFKQSEKITEIINKFLEENYLNSENKIHHVIKGNSLTSFFDLKYPDDTCPYIDAAIECVNNDLRIISDEIHEIEMEISVATKNSANNLSPADLKVTEHISRLHHLELERDLLRGDLTTAEELRANCEELRQFITDLSSNYKNRINVYITTLEDYVVIELPKFDFTSHLWNSQIHKLNKIHNEYSFKSEHFKSAIKNHNAIFTMGEEFIERLDQKDDFYELLGSNVLYREDFINFFKREIF